MVQTVCRLGGKYSRDGSTGTKKKCGKTAFFRLQNAPNTCYIVVAHKVGKGEYFD